MGNGLHHGLLEHRSREPDGRWLAYASDETGRYEVWVRPFPDIESGNYRISGDVGLQPRWAHNGLELFYFRDNRELVAVEYETSSGFRVVTRESLLTLPPDLLYNRAADPYDVANDDQRFIMGRQYSEGGVAQAYLLVQNFVEELKARVPN